MRGLEGSWFSWEWEIGVVVRVRGDEDAVGMRWCRRVRRVLADGAPLGRRNCGIATGILFARIELLEPGQWMTPLYVWLRMFSMLGFASGFFCRAAGIYIT